MTSLNRAFTRLSMRRRYEAWFLRLGLADGSGAWWFRYLLTNPGRRGCPGIPGAAPVQVWATWFPRDGHPETFIREFPIDELSLGPRQGPFSLDAGPNHIEDDSCRGAHEARGHRISWDLHYHSHFGATLSHKGWIGFSRTPHSDCTFRGEIRFDDRVFRGDPLGVGVQGHNCGFRHRNFWTWAHACFPQPDGGISTFEALVYEMPFGLVFRKAILWHQGRPLVFRKLRESCRDREQLRWNFQATSAAGTVEVDVEGGGASLHRLPYAKTDCSGTFEVSNNSRARAQLRLRLRNSKGPEELTTEGGAVLEMTGDC
jgi:hypothetical protein